MKILAKISVLVILTIFLATGSVMAYPFMKVVGAVNPASATFSDNPDGTTSITGLEYTFTVVKSIRSSEMMGLSLKFEDDIFASVSGAYDYDPSDWTSSSLTFRDSYYALSFAGTSIALGESLSFTVDVDIYTAALTDSTLWDTGGIWGQSWYALSTSWGLSRGSTAAVPQPEPGTLLLLGAGIGGLAAMRRRKARKSA